LTRLESILDLIEDIVEWLLKWSRVDNPNLLYSELFDLKSGAFSLSLWTV
jgi:hypothetical protein